MSEFSLPKHLPAIVLPLCAFLPHGLLPLHIYEERYREMLRHALLTDRIFCVAMEGEGPDGDRILDLTDLRNWATGLHAGSRRVVEGRL